MADLWAYEGWCDVSSAAGQMRQPQHNFPRGLIGGTLIVIALYLSASLACLHVLTPQEIASSERVALTAPSSRRRRSSPRRIPWRPRPASR